jgi:hypothetical protein
MPAQQSASVVHDCPACSQALGLHCSAPVGPGTHGLPLQHWLAAEHASRAAMHVPASPPTYGLQRGTPSGSGPHTCHFGPVTPFGRQQLERALELVQA